MKAAVYEAYGSAEVMKIKEVDKPTPKENEVLIRIKASTVTSGDCRLRRADPFAVRFFNGLTRPKRIKVPGNEFAGVIEAVGKGVTLFCAGDQVFGQTGINLGANAEYICLQENGTLTTKPEELTYEEAAVIPFGGNTALHFLKKGKIKNGDKVLIYGASGSLGTAAVQLAKFFGAEVTGVCSSNNVELVKSLGADKVIDYTTEDFTGVPTYHTIFDTVGKSPFSDCVNSLQQNGIYLRSVHMDFLSIVRGGWTSLTSSKKVIGGIATERKENLIFLKKLIKNGYLKPVIDRCYTLDQIVEAHNYVDKGHKKGNCVLMI